MTGSPPFRIALLLVLIPLLTGCGSTVGVGGGSGSLASTTIKNSSRNSVNEAVKATFREEGFTLIHEGSNSFKFRKWGGRSTEIIYGTWFTDGVAIEPEVLVFDKGSGTFSVHCDVYMREHQGREVLDANYRLKASGKAAYSGLMRKIRKRAEGRR